MNQPNVRFSGTPLISDLFEEASKKTRLDREKEEQEKLRREQMRAIAKKSSAKLNEIQSGSVPAQEKKWWEYQEPEVKLEVPEKFKVPEQIANITNEPFVNLVEKIGNWGVNFSENLNTFSALEDAQDTLNNEKVAYELRQKMKANSETNIDENVDLYAVNRLKNSKFTDEEYSKHASDMAQLKEETRQLANYYLDNVDFVTKHLVAPILHDVIEITNPTDWGDMFSAVKTAANFIPLSKVAKFGRPVYNFLANQAVEAGVNTSAEIAKRYVDEGETVTSKEAAVAYGQGFAAQVTIGIGAKALSHYTRKLFSYAGHRFNGGGTPESAQTREAFYNIIDEAMGEPGYSARHEYTVTGTGTNPYVPAVTPAVDEAIANQAMFKTVDGVNVPFLRSTADGTVQNSVLINPTPEEVLLKTVAEPENNTDYLFRGEQVIRGESKFKQLKDNTKMPRMETPIVKNRGDMTPTVSKITTYAEVNEISPRNVINRQAKIVNYDLAKNVFDFTRRIAREYKESGHSFNKEDHNVKDLARKIAAQYKAAQDNSAIKFLDVSRRAGYESVQDLVLSTRYNSNLNFGELYSVMGEGNKVEANYKKNNPKEYAIASHLYENSKVLFSAHEAAPGIEPDTPLFKYMSKNADVLEEIIGDSDISTFRMAHGVERQDIAAIHEANLPEKRKLIRTFQDAVLGTMEELTGKRLTQKEAPMIYAEGTISRNNISTIKNQLAAISNPETADAVLSNPDIMASLEELNSFYGVEKELNKFFTTSQNKYVKKYYQAQQTGIINIKRIGAESRKIYKEVPNTKVDSVQSTIPEFRDEIAQKNFEQTISPLMDEFMKPHNKEHHDFIFKQRIGKYEVDITSPKSMKNLMDTGYFENTKEALGYINTIQEDKIGKVLMERMGIDSSMDVATNADYISNQIFKGYGIEPIDFIYIDDIDNPNFGGYVPAGNHIFINKARAQNLTSGQWFNFILEEITHYRDHMATGRGLGYRGNTIGTQKRFDFNQNILEKSMLFYEGKPTNPSNFLIGETELTPEKFNKIRESVDLIHKRSPKKSKTYIQAESDQDLMDKSIVYAMNARGAGHFISSLDQEMNLAIADQITNRMEHLQKTKDIPPEKVWHDMLRTLQGTTSGKRTETIADLQKFFKTPEDMYNAIVKISSNTIDETGAIEGFFPTPEQGQEIFNKFLTRDTEIMAFGQSKNELINSLTPGRVKKTLTTTTLEDGEPLLKPEMFADDHNRIILGVKNGLKDSLSSLGFFARDNVKEFTGLKESSQTLTSKAISKAAVVLNYRVPRSTMYMDATDIGAKIMTGRMTLAEGMKKLGKSAPELIKDGITTRLAQVPLLARNIVGIVNEENIMYKSFDKTYKLLRNEKLFNDMHNMTTTDYLRVSADIDFLTSNISEKDILKGDLWSKLTKDASNGINKDETRAMGRAAKDATDTVLGLASKNFDDLAPFYKEKMKSYGIKNQDDFSKFQEGELRSFLSSNPLHKERTMTYRESDFTNANIIKDIFWGDYAMGTPVASMRDVTKLSPILSDLMIFARSSISQFLHIKNAMTHKFDGGYYQPTNVGETMHKLMLHVAVMGGGALTLKMFDEILDIARNRDITLSGIREQLAGYREDPLTLAKDSAEATLGVSFDLLMKSGGSPFQAVFNMVQQSVKDLEKAIEEKEPARIVPILLRTMGLTQVAETIEIGAGIEKDKDKPKRGKGRVKRGKKSELVASTEGIKKYINSSQFEENVLQSYQDLGYDVVFNNLEEALKNSNDTYAFNESMYNDEEQG